MKVSFNGFNEKELTFKCEEEIPVGSPVKISANSTVAVCNENDAFIGFCTYSDSENATVQMAGHVKISYSGQAPELGRNTLAAGADNSVSKSASGVNVTVLNVDTTEMSVEFLF